MTDADISPDVQPPPATNSAPVPEQQPKRPKAHKSLGPPRSLHDNLTQSGAEELAAKLDAYWHARGFPAARHWAVEAYSGPCITWVVRSNFVNALPPPPHPKDMP